MAGIAFRLQKLLSGESYTDLIRAYIYSSFIASGPFLVVIATMSSLRMAVTNRLSLEEGTIFMALIVYEFAFSMLGVSPFLYVVTRYIADRYYQKRMEAFTPTYVAVLEIVFVLQSIVAILYLRILPLPISTKIILYCLYQFLSGIWIAMIFLSAARNYVWIVLSFIFGGMIAIGAALILGRTNGFNGFLMGFTLGQGACFCILNQRIFSEFGITRSHDYGFISYLRKHTSLVFIGLFYYFGIWVDKFIMWFSPTGLVVLPGLHLFPDYDAPLFLAYVSVIPSMAFFLVQMETSFVRYYISYYRAIRTRAPLTVIRRARMAMIENVSDNFQKFVIFQGALSGFVILFIIQIADAFYLNPAEMGVLRIGILGAFLQMGFLLAINIFFYFDLKKDVLFLTIIFFVSNIVFTLITYHIGVRAYGFGYASTCFVSLACAIFILDSRLKDLDYLTFMQQPILQPKFKFEADTR